MAKVVFIDPADYSHGSPAIPLDMIPWKPIGEGEDPKTRLLASLNIGGLMMHLEAREIDPNEELQTTIDYPEDMGPLAAAAGDSAFETLNIDGREYFLFALPFGA